VLSKRGPGGGYQLARPPAEVTLADVITAVQGDVLALPEGSSRASDDAPDFVWERVHSEVSSALAGITISDLCREAAERGIERADGEPAMYQI
jgi:DNA-binding IscR family transcriptional regulator